LNVDFTPAGTGTDTLVIEAQSGPTTQWIRVIVHEWEYPVRTAPVLASPASSHIALDGSLLFSFSGTYGAPVQVHFSDGAVRNTVLNSLTVFGNRYSLVGYTNNKGCYMPEPATFSVPTGSPTPVVKMVPCEKCHH
jgi:hypothetical protein